MSFDHIEEITSTHYLGHPSMIEYLKDFFVHRDRKRIAKFFTSPPPTAIGGTAYNLLKICNHRKLDYCEVANWIVSVIAYPSKNDIEWWMK